MGTGYACPVCDALQADAAHLANHLAFTAMLGDDDHEAWLDERVPDWADRNPETLGPAVAEHAPERDRTASTGDPAGDARGRGDEREHQHGHDHARERDHAPRTPGDSFESELARQGGYGRDAGAAGGDVDRVLAEARDLTERMAGTDPLGDDGDEPGDEGENEREDGGAADAGEGADGDAAGGPDASESEAETE
jgi:hypothetical protein